MSNTKQFPFSQEWLRTQYRYDSATGIFYAQRTNRKVGYNHPHGYVFLAVQGKNYRAHRLAWFYVFGSEPDMLDHIDRNTYNNRIDNLRPATHSQNAFNARLRVNNVSGRCGVSLHSIKKKWEAFIRVKGKKIWLGYFVNKDSAIAARVIAERFYFGDFAPDSHLSVAELIRTLTNQIDSPK